MERQEKKFLEAIKHSLERDLKRIDHLIRQAKPPKLTRPGEVPARVQEIIDAIKNKGGKVTKQELVDIVGSAGMIVTAVGALYQAGYLKKDLKDKGYVVLGPKARSRRARGRPKGSQNQ